MQRYRPNKRQLFDGTVDPRCRELVDYFLPAKATENERAAMAHNIQDVVDDWLADWAAPTE
jgi:hypothetical protein